MRRLLKIHLWVALSIVGSAISLSSCGDSRRGEKDEVDESLMTEYSENLSIVESQNGKRSYHFTTPLIEGYSQAKEPYREFRKGIKMVTYQDDSLSSVDVVLTANYAIHYQKRDLWEAKGNVVVKKYDGKTLYTQQLFWNARTKKIYSNVDSKIVQNEGRDIVLVEGFESDEQFRDWRARAGKSHMEVDFQPNTRKDSTQVKPSTEVSPKPMVKSESVDARKVAKERAEKRETSKRKVAQPATNSVKSPDEGIHLFKQMFNPEKSDSTQQALGAGEANATRKPLGEVAKKSTLSAEKTTLGRTQKRTLGGPSSQDAKGAVQSLPSNKQPLRLE